MLQELSKQETKMKTRYRYLMIGFGLILLIIIVTSTGCSTCNICGIYVSQENPNIYLEFRSDGTFREPASVGYMEGLWYLNGNKVTITTQLGTQTVTLVGNEIIDSNGGIWVKSRR
jgi:hypothetical protein